MVVGALLRVMKIQVGSYRAWRRCDTPIYLYFAGYDWLGILFFSRLDSSPWYCREWLGIELAWESEERMDMLQNIYSWVPQCKRPRYYKLRRRPRQSFFQAKSLNVWPNYQNITHWHTFAFSIGIFHLLLSQSAEIQTKSVYRIHPKIGQGRSRFSFKDYCLWRP